VAAVGAGPAVGHAQDAAPTAYSSSKQHMVLLRAP
jgi:hypothetical protein